MRSHPAGQAVVAQAAWKRVRWYGTPTFMGKSLNKDPMTDHSVQRYVTCLTHVSRGVRSETRVVGARLVS